MVAVSHSEVRWFEAFQTCVWAWLYVVFLGRPVVGHVLNCRLARHLGFVETLLGGKLHIRWLLPFVEVHGTYKGQSAMYRSWWGPLFRTHAVGLKCAGVRHRGPLLLIAEMPAGRVWLHGSMLSFGWRVSIHDRLRDRPATHLNVENITERLDLLIHLSDVAAEYAKQEKPETVPFHVQEYGRQLKNSEK